VWQTLTTTLLGLIFGGLGTYLGSRAQLRIQAEHEFDKALRELRLPHYQALFHLTECIPRQWKEELPPTRSTLHAMRLGFHDWYFGSVAGGMFLSRPARDAYFALQNELQSAVASLPGEDDRVSDSGSKLLRARASAVRHQLSADLGVAEPARQRWMLPESIAPPTH
jgi:hypothetical protein